MNFTYSFLFDKLADIRYISHLDLMRLFHRALRRTGFKLYLTQGFSPRPIVRIKNALKLGLEARDQEAEFVLEELIDREVFLKRLNQYLPEGISAKSG
jgi:radical SAM-linked protein